MTKAPRECKYCKKYFRMNQGEVIRKVCDECKKKNIKERWIKIKKEKRNSL